jgi:hypothetical protein
MARKRVSRQDRDLLARLVETYSATLVIRAVKKLPATTRKVGRPSNNLGNLASVYGYIEFHRKERMAAGRVLGISGACERLKRALDAYTVNCRTTVGRLRSMFYQAQSEAKSNSELASFMRQSLSAFEAASSEVFPLLMVKTKDGLQSPIIDMVAFRAGQEAALRRPKNGH